MAYIRRLPSGLYQATVRTPAGRVTFSDPLRKVVEDWADEQEVELRRRNWIDPRGGLRTVESVWEEFAGSRQIEKATRHKDDSHWRTYVKPRWGPVQIGTILKPHVAAWVKGLEDDETTNGWSIIAALNVLKAALELAVDAGLIRSNPARRVKAPMPPAHDDRLITLDERGVILARADEIFPGRIDARPFIETLAETGCRWEEVAAVRKRALDLRRLLVHVGPVMERDGTIREYPKAARGPDSAGFRSQPISQDLGERLKPRLAELGPEDLVFTAPRGGPLLYPTWRSRVWVKIMRVPAVDPATGKRVRGRWEPLIPEPLPTPHDLRHAYGTALGEAGLPRHDIQAAMGHDDYRSSARYSHSDEDERHKRIRRAMGW